MDIPRRTDVFWVGCLGSLGILYLYLRGAFSALPFEDAAILMRYVDHLAKGKGIVWNLGEAPVDGATDFLFVLLAAALQSLGLKTEVAVQSLNLLSYLGSVFLVYAAWRRGKRSVSLAIFPATWIMLGPAYAYIEAYFGTTFFAFFGTYLAFIGLKVLERPTSTRFSCLFGIASLLLGLSRPEGVLLSFFILLALIYELGLEKSHSLIKCYLIFLVGIGSFYLIWHYQYFDHLLPNPFYKKGGGYIYPASLLQSLLNTARLLFPLILLIAFLKVKKIRLAKWLYLGFPIMAFASIWIFLSSEMNYLMRFQYVLLPITLINLSFLWNENAFQKITPFSKNLVAIVLFISTCGYYLFGFTSESIHRDGRYEVAKILRQYKSDSYSLATTEAGLLPFYSAWRSLDTWGLNDHKIAIEGVISQEYLASFNPDLIMYDAFRSDNKALRGSIWNSYGDMIDTLSLFVAQNDYKLIAMFPGSEGKHAHFYYLKNGLPDGDSLSYKIRNCSYYWYEDGTVSKPAYPMILRE